MKTGAILGIFLFLLTAIALSLPDMAEAARMGGGRSFGSRPSMSQPARTPTANRSATQTPGAQAQAPRSGFLGGMGGLMGGLLAGTLLGSLLGGHGFQGGGFMDLILLAILAFIGYKLFMRFRNRQASPAAAGPAFPSSSMSDSGSTANGPMMRSDSSGWGAISGLSGAAASANPKVDVPADFDTEDFLKGAKAAYNRMQQSWDRRDLDDIAQFATPAVINELREQARLEPNPGRTEIMLVNASLLGVEDEGDDRRAQVYFDVLMREDPNQTTPNNAREIWHFLRQGQNGSWKLDGIQQVN